MTRNPADVLVIGAGPAGSVAAALLARRGISVRVLEREKFPRFSIGESLLACSVELLQEAGMLDAVTARNFQFKNGAVFDRNGESSEFNFADKSSPGSSFTFQVPRAEFDATLAAEAQRQGADIRFEVEITAVDFDGDAAAGHEPHARPANSRLTRRASCSTHRASAARCPDYWGSTGPRHFRRAARSSRTCATTRSPAPSTGRKSASASIPPNMTSGPG